MKTKLTFVLSLLVAVFFLSSCEDILKEKKTEVKQVTGSWISSAGRDVNSFRNMHYTFELSKATDIKLEIISEEDPYIYVVNELGLKVIESNNRKIEEKLESGKYELIVGTFSSAKQGTFQLKYSGIDKLVKIESKNEQIVGTWKNSGGREPNSFRNIHYNLEIEQDTYLDIFTQSEVDSYLYLIDDLGFITEGINHLSKKVKPGKYKLVVATFSESQPTEGVSGNFILSIFGQYSKIEKMKVAELTLQGRWDKSGGRDYRSSSNPKYQFHVDKKSFVDVLVLQPTSAKVDEYIYLIKPNGDVLESYLYWMLHELEAGDYTIVVGTYSENQSGNFILQVNGSNVSNLVKK